MSSVVSRLAPKDRKALALFYETETYTSLKKLISQVRGNAAKKCLTAFDFLEVKHLQGQEHALKVLLDEIEKIHKSDQKR